MILQSRVYELGDTVGGGGGGSSAWKNRNQIFMQAEAANTTFSRIWGRGGDVPLDCIRQKVFIYNAELRNRYAPTDTSMRWAGHVARMENAYRIMVGKPNGNRQLVRTRSGWGQ
jgi:hypothetical protein